MCQNKQTQNNCHKAIKQYSNSRSKVFVIPYKHFAVAKDFTVKSTDTKLTFTYYVQ